MTSIAWLQISDLHQTVHGLGWRGARSRQAVLEDLAELHAKLSRVDFVIVAGDLTMRGAPEEFEEAERSLEELLGSFRKLGSDPWLLAVPGNHDLARPSDPSPAALQAMRRWHEDPSVREEFWSDHSSPARRLVDRAFQSFDRWWRAREFSERQRGGKRLDRLSLRHGLLPGDFTATIEKDGVRFGVAGLNSAFLQGTGDDYEGRLAMEPHQLNIAAGGDVPAWIAEHDAALLITHHAPEWLAPDLSHRYETAINPQGRFCAHLCAHLHERTVELAQAGARPRIRCPSFFGIDTWEDRRGRHGDRVIGYTAARIDLKRGALEVFPRRWVADQLIHDDEVKLPVALVPRLDESRPFRLETAALRDALALAHPSPDAARRVAESVKLRIGHRRGGAAADVWHVVVSEAEHRRRLPALIEAASTGGRLDARISEAWRAYQKADDGGASRPVDVQLGSMEQRLADLLYEQLADLHPAAFESVVTALALADEVPGDDAPQTTRAIAIVRRCERDGLPGLERLLAAVLHALGRGPAMSTQSGKGVDADTWLPLLLLLLGGVAVGVGIGMLVAGNRGDTSAPRRVATRTSLTKLLAIMFSEERDFDGFVLDQFPAVYRSFTAGMNRAYRIRVLLDNADPGEIVTRLRRAYPSAFNAYERVLDYEDTAEPLGSTGRTRVR